MFRSIASSDMLKLAALTGVGVGIMWALQMLGFGPSWIIGTAGSAGVAAGIVYAAATLRDPNRDEAFVAPEFTA